MWSSSVPGRRPSAGKSTPRPRPRTFRPILEPLKDRLAPAVFTVTSLVDSNAAGSGSLRRAITDSNGTAGGNEIDVTTAGTYTLTLNGVNDDNTAGDLDVLKSVNIVNQSGGSVVIDAGGLTNHDRVFDLAPTGAGVNVTITGVTIQGGSTTEGGGGIRAQNGSNLVLIDDVIQNNTAGAAGGGGVLVLSGGNFTVTNCLVASNKAGKSNNGFGGGGVRVQDTGDVTVTGSEFSHNSTTGDGGGFLCFNTTTSLSIASSTFNANHAGPADNATGGNGAGLDLPTNNATLTNVTVSGNTADVEGGGIQCASTVADGIVLRSLTIAFNSAGSRGGGILSVTGTGTVKLIDTVVAKNTAGVGGHPDVDNDDQGVGLADGGHNFIGSNDGASAGLVAGTPNAQGSVVGTSGAARDPLLAPLADNGGRVLPDGTHLLTHADQPNNGNDGVVDRGTNTGAPATDERGFPRTVDALVDVGAFEFQHFDVFLGTAAPAGSVHAELPAPFTFTVTNNGPNPSLGVSVSTTLPPGPLVLSASTSFTIVGTPAGNVVTVAVPDLASGASTTVTLTILPRDPGPLTVTATLSSHDDPTLANNTSSASVVVLPQPTPLKGFADVTSLVRVVRQGRRRPRRRLLFLVTNGSTTSIQGPVGLVAVLPRGVKLRNATGLTAGRQGFVRLDVGGDNIFDPGESASVALVFSRPFNPQRLSVLAGAFG
jgi:uncharacterized repeat protein (TIGR01451 family)